MTKPANIRTPLGIPAALMLGAAIVAGAAFATGVRAQTAAPSEPPAAAAAQQFSEQDLQSYASAVVKVQDISVKWQDKMRTAKDPAATTEIQKKAEDEAVTAVKGEGLTVEKYNRIALATETDAELRNKVLDYVSKAK